MNLQSIVEQATADYKQSAYFKSYVRDTSQKLYIVTITLQDGRERVGELWTMEPFKWAKTIAHRLSGRARWVEIKPYSKVWTHTEICR